jgi:hypothetical protein
MKYRIVFTWLDDNTRDCFEIKGITELKFNIKDIKEKGLHKITEIYQINKNGEYVPYNKIKF